MTGMFDEEMAAGMRATQDVMMRRGISYEAARLVVLAESRYKKPIIRYSRGARCWVLWEHQNVGARSLLQSESLASLIGIVVHNPKLFKRA